MRIRARGARTYRRHKPVPAAIILVVLVAAAGVVWLKLFYHQENIDQRVSCPASGGQQVPYDGLRTVAPQPAATVPVRVLNAGDQHGLATRVALQLDQYGFDQTVSGGNDPAYPQENLHCLGQIRFGVNGLAAARTLSLAVPCTQLVRDDRHDDSVDLVLGTGFTELTPNAAANTVLRQLSDWASTHPQSPGGLQSHADAMPRVDQNLLSEAHSTAC